jgi:xanthosine phosphorylase
MNTTVSDLPLAAAQYILKKRPGFTPKVGVVLGSGLSKLADTLNDPVHFSYEELPGFPKLTVHGHDGQLSTGYIGNVGVVFLKGRAHNYEGQHQDSVKTYVRTLKRLGCEYFIATNASGSLRAEVIPGSLMLVNDHINLQPSNPLVGPNDDQYGERFYPLDNAYDKSMQEKFKLLAQKLNIPLAEGVYISVLGPHYETGAEIRAFKVLGADAVGMSTVPEVLVANHCGLKVGVIATITNLATGLATTSHSHHAVVETANMASLKLSQLITAFIEDLK